MWALQLVNARIIGHKEWTTGGAKGWMTRGNVKERTGSALSSVYAYAYVSAAQGWQGQILIFMASITFRLLIPPIKRSGINIIISYVQITANVSII